MIHLYAPPGLFPATACGLDRVWGNPYAAVYGKDLHLVDCPDCLGRVEIPTGEPYTADDAARLRRGMRFSLLFAAPFWVALFVAVGRWMT
jgi:hypothetical protein